MDILFCSEPSSSSDLFELHRLFEWHRSQARQVGSAGGTALVNRLRSSVVSDHRRRERLPPMLQRFSLTAPQLPQRSVRTFHASPSLTSPLQGAAWAASLPSVGLGSPQPVPSQVGGSTSASPFPCCFASPTSHWWFDFRLSLFPCDRHRRLLPL